MAGIVMENVRIRQVRERDQGFVSAILSPKLGGR